MDEWIDRVEKARSIGQFMKKMAQKSHQANIWHQIGYQADELLLLYLHLSIDDWEREEREKTEEKKKKQQSMK